jgi:hypothetical protein
MVPKNVVIGLLGSVVLGVASGLLLGSTAVGYWIAQVVAIVGGFLGGTEHVGWRPGLVRGLVSGAIFGTAILVTRAATGWTDEVDLGSTPGFLVVITTVIGLLLGAAGGAVHARRTRVRA